MATDNRTESGFYCSTSGTYFVDKESLAEHYKSDFHRYNLKRKVAGLPPVTKEWFDSRKAQLSSVSTTTVQKIWFDPLTRKKFSTENTYQAHVRSKKYQDLVKKSGEPAPEPVIMLKKLDEDGEQQQQAQDPSAAPAPSAAKPKGFTVKPASYRQADTPMADASGASEQQQQQQEEEVQSEEGSGWETASDADIEDSSQWAEWDVCVSLFDSHVSRSFEANLEYMFKNYGFYLPDAQYLKDPEGLLRYLGAKLQYGRVPLYSAGSDDNAKQFRSLHAVQRHMVDRNQCKLLYEGNEEEYEDFYDYSELEAALAEGAGALVASAEELAAAGGYELVVAGGADGAGAGKVLGSREFSRYYRQRHKPVDSRQSVAVNTVIARYRSLGVDVSPVSTVEAQQRKVAKKWDARAMKSKLQLLQKSNVIRNLPNNVPY